MDEIQIQFFTNAKVKRYVDQLVKSGLYGISEAECVERLVCRQLEDLVMQGSLEETDVPPG